MFMLMSIYVHVYAHLDAHAHVYVLAYVDVYLYIYVYIYIHIYIKSIQIQTYKISNPFPQTPAYRLKYFNILHNNKFHQKSNISESMYQSQKDLFFSFIF